MHRHHTTSLDTTDRLLSSTSLAPKVEDVAPTPHHVAATRHTTSAIAVPVLKTDSLLFRRMARHICADGDAASRERERGDRQKETTSPYFLFCSHHKFIMRTRYRQGPQVTVGGWSGGAAGPKPPKPSALRSATASQGIRGGPRGGVAQPPRPEGHSWGGVRWGRGRDPHLFIPRYGRFVVEQLVRHDRIHDTPPESGRAVVWWWSRPAVLE